MKEGMKHSSDGPLRLVVAGGGTGGHIFPAVAIANAIKKRLPDAQILFVGAKGKMEMEKVPAAGYEIVGLDIAGFNRSSLIKNWSLPFKLLKSFWQVRSILKKMKPHAAIGVGGYSTFPVLKAAQVKGIPTFIHEANSFAGKSNVLLAKGATKVFTAIDGMEAFFPAEKIVVTGNPVRAAIKGAASVSREEALNSFGLSAERKTVLIVGGSLGARSINEAVRSGLEALLDADLQLIWQTGNSNATVYADAAKGKAAVWVSPFINNMEAAYAAADVVVARAGAMTVAELSVVQKPVVFVPYPHAAEDHQTVNAQRLVTAHAALMVKDSEAGASLVPTVLRLSADENEQQKLKQHIARFGITDADERVATEILSAINIPTPVTA